jgi:hypothetical protein
MAIKKIFTGNSKVLNEIMVKKNRKRLEYCDHVSTFQPSSTVRREGKNAKGCQNDENTSLCERARSKMKYL